MKGIRRITVQAYDGLKRRFRPGELIVNEGRVMDLHLTSGENVLPSKSTMYLSDGFIDSHAHVYPGATDLGIPVDRIGHRTGVHLVVDAGSAGSINFPCFRDYVMPAHETPIKAFLNISRIGLVTKQPYYDSRVVDIPAAVDVLQQDGGQYLLGIKILASGLILEAAGLKPVQAGVKAAREAGRPLMAHFGEGPPLSEEILAYLEQGDIITHCFHGAPNHAALSKAARNSPMNPAYYSEDNILWHKDGTPTVALEKALNKGVYLDVGHGAASLDKSVAQAAIQQGIRNFSISTDAHIRNVDTVVHSLSHTMSKFLGFGLTLDEVVAAVTVIPARQLGFTSWCGNLTKRATLFRVRPLTPDDPPLVDAYESRIEGSELIEPVGIIKDGMLIMF